MSPEKLCASSFKLKKYPFICLKNLDASRFFKQIN